MSLAETPPRVTNEVLDARFTADMSNKMTVPHHIRVAGGTPHKDTFGPGLFDEKTGQYTHKMRVPDRILVAGTFISRGTVSGLARKGGGALSCY